MQDHRLDNFIFTVGSMNRQGHSRLHTLSEFLTLPDSILTRHQDAKPIPIGRRYTFGRLRDAVKAELGDTGTGFKFIVLNAAQGEARFNVNDQASLSSFVSILAANIEGGKLDLASPSFEARLVPTDREDRCPRQETPMAIHTAPSQKAKAKTPVFLSPKLPILMQVHTTTPREDRGKAAAKAVIATEDDDEDTDGILGFLRKKNLITGDKVRALAWTFNIDNADTIDIDTTWKVPGMLSEATISQCAFMYELGLRLRADKNMGGVVTATIAIASVWEDHYIDFIEPIFIGMNFPFRGEPVLHAYNWHEKMSLRPLGQSPYLSLASFMVEPILPRMSKSNARRVYEDAPARPRWTVDELGEALENAPNATQLSFQPHLRFTPQHRMSLIIIGRERLSLNASSTSTPDSDVVECWVKAAGQPARAIEVAKCFLLDPSVVICDEA
ncbi:hypothetical protein SNK04_013683 [Fusarium graminearum]